MTKALRSLDGVREIKEGAELSDFIFQVDPKKIPSGEALAKALPEGYAYEGMRFDEAAGDVIRKDGELRFTPWGSDRSYVLLKADLDPKPAEHPLDALGRLAQDGPVRCRVSGNVGEEKKEGKTLWTLALAAARRADEAKK
ncbi:MAG: hypothetical protein HY716_09355 [Planctomycetes bacterium]|nr:hypothetical protein [Planctomycetota bacterium]